MNDRSIGLAFARGARVSHRPRRNRKARARGEQELEAVLERQTSAESYCH